MKDINTDGTIIDEAGVSEKLEATVSELLSNI